MLQFFFKRLLVLIPTFLGITIVSFGLIRLVPGDPVQLLLGERGASPEVYEEMRKHLGLDQSIVSQYLHFLGRAVTGDFGESIVSKRPVLEEFSSRFPATLELGLISLFFATVIGIPLGILAALKRNSFFDYSVMGTALVGYSMPIFWWGLLLIMFFSVKLGWAPVSGRISPEFDVESWSGFLLIDTWVKGEGWIAFKSACAHLILPCIAIGTIPLAVIARMTRSSMLEVIGEDYVRTAKAKGLSHFTVIYVHALRNAMIPVLTVIGLLVGSLVTGAILTESIFSWPGLGRWLVASVTSRDYPVIQSAIFFIASLIVIINLSVDLLYAVFNPRMRGQK
jgi:dipeptide transport system permease protein